MKYLVLVIILSIIVSSNDNIQVVRTDCKAEYIDTTEVIGFLFIDISNIYNNGGEVNVCSVNGIKMLQIKDTSVFVKCSEFELIKDEHLYSRNISVEAFFPEYGLFVIKCYAKHDGNYYLSFNNKICIIKEKTNNIEFKNLEKYILGTYPIPTDINPLRTEPNDSSPVIANFSEFTYVSVEIKGDWVKLKDDKDCYSGEESSKVDIEGWVRWRKDGVYVLKVAYVC